MTASTTRLREETCASDRVFSFFRRDSAFLAFFAALRTARFLNNASPLTHLLGSRNPAA